MAPSMGCGDVRETSALAFKSTPGWIVFPGGKREFRRLSSPPRKPSCGAFPGLPGACMGVGVGRVGGMIRRTCAQARLPAKSVRKEGKGGAHSSPPQLPFPEEPGSPHQRQSTHHKEAWKWMCMQWCRDAHCLPQTKRVCAAGREGGRCC